jgi:hypothetical protein
MHQACQSSAVPSGVSPRMGVVFRPARGRMSRALRGVLAHVRALSRIRPGARWHVRCSQTRLMNPSSLDMFESLDVRDTLPDASTLERLTSLCAQELSAAQTYQQALTIAAVGRHAGVLSRCYASHRNRASVLMQRVASFEGTVPKSPGVWPPLRPLVAVPVPVASERLVIDLLERAEQEWTRNYRDEMPALTLTDREFLSNRVIPAQNATHAALADLKQQLIFGLPEK